MTACVANLKEANERVGTLTLQRTNEKMGVTVGALKAARTASDDAYRALVKIVNALALVFCEKDYTAFIDYANTEITHYKREVLNQKAKTPSTSGSSTVDSAIAACQAEAIMVHLQAVILHRVEVHHLTVIMVLSSWSKISNDIRCCFLVIEGAASNLKKENTRQK